MVRGLRVNVEVFVDDLIPLERSVFSLKPLGWRCKYIKLGSNTGQPAAKPEISAPPHSPKLINARRIKIQLYISDGQQLINPLATSTDEYHEHKRLLANKHKA